jgi:hypothetical protein
LGITVADGKSVPKEVSEEQKAAEEAKAAAGKGGKAPAKDAKKGAVEE